MTDGVFSMDGDCAPLVEISMLSKKYNALLIVDDAHGIGVLGKRGAGLAEELNLEKEIDLLIGTFGKVEASSPDSFWSYSGATVQPGVDEASL